LRPLNETFKDLDGKLSQMTDKEKTNVLNTLFNKVDLKSVNALLANSGERFDELSGYIRNSAGAAADMAETMNDNLKGKLTILGSALEGLGIEMYEEFEQPFKEAAETAIKSVDTISYSLKNGKLSESMQTVARAIGSMASKAAELAINALPKMIDGFAFLVDNAKILGTVLASTAGAVATFKGVMLFNDIQNSLKAATTAARMFGAGMTTSLTGMQAAVGVATGKLGIMQAAVAALGSPMGVAAIAVAGVTAGLIALHFATNDEAEAMKEMKKSTEEAAKELENRKAAWEEVQNTSREQISLNADEIDSTKEMVDELQTLVDENGKVGESKERVKYLTDKINEMAPDSIKWVDDETIAYQQEADAIKKALDQKKAAMSINELQDDRSAAQKNMKESLDQQVELRKQIEETEQKLSEAYQKIDEATKNQNDHQLQYWTAQKNEYEKFLNDKKALLNQEVEEYQSYAETIDIINEAEQAYANENYEEVERILGKINLSYKDAKTASIEELQQQSEELQAKYDALADTVGEGSSDTAKQIKEEIEKLLDETNQELQSKTAALEKQMEQSGRNAVEGFIRGLKSKGGIQGAINASFSLGTMALNSLNKSLDERSPSKETEKSGKYFDEGLAIGIQENKSSVMESVEDLSQEALDIANKSSSDYKEIGELYGENYLSGLETMLDGTVELIEKNTDTMIKTYEKSMEEQTDASVKEIEAQTDAQVEAIDDQISKLKDVKDKAQKEANKEEIKQKEKEKKQIKEYSKERIQQIKDDAKEQTNAYKKGMQTLEKAGIDIIKKASSDIEKEYKKRQDAIVEQFQSQKDEILSLQDSLYSKTSEYGELFHYDEETGEMLLNDLTKNTQAVEQYYNSLEELSNIEGISDGFVKMIATEYDVEEGTKLLNELLKMSDTRLQSYAAEWDKLQEVSSKGSQSFLEEELNVIDTSFNQAMEKLANDMPVFTKEALNNAINEIATIFPEKYAELIAIDPNFFDNMINTLNAEILGSISTQEGVVVPVKTEVGDIAQQVTEQTPAVQQAGSELTISIAETVENEGDEVVDAVDNVSKDSVQAMESYKPDFKEVGADYIDMLTEGMKSKWSTAVSVASDIARSLKEELEEVASFSVRSNEEAMTARQLVESAEPSLLHSLYNDMLSAVEIQQSRVAAASASYITNNNQSSTVENNMGDINFNIAEVKGNSADRSVDKLMQQAEFYRRQRNLAVGVR